MKFAAADYQKISALAKNATTNIAIKKLDGNSFGKSFVEAYFKTKRRNGTSVGVEVYTASLGQKTNGSIKVQKTKSGDRNFLTFTFDLNVTKLVVKDYNKSGFVTSTKTQRSAATLKGTCKVKLD